MAIPNCIAMKSICDALFRRLSPRQSRTSFAWHPLRNCESRKKDAGSKRTIFNPASNNFGYSLDSCWLSGNKARQALSSCSDARSRNRVPSFRAHLPRPFFAHLARRYEPPSAKPGGQNRLWAIECKSGASKRKQIAY